MAQVDFLEVYRPMISSRNAWRIERHAARCASRVSFPLTFDRSARLLRFQAVSGRSVGSVGSSFRTAGGAALGAAMRVGSGVWGGCRTSSGRLQARRSPPPDGSWCGDGTEVEGEVADRLSGAKKRSAEDRKIGIGTIYTLMNTSHGSGWRPCEDQFPLETGGFSISMLVGV